MRFGPQAFFALTIACAAPAAQAPLARTTMHARSSHLFGLNESALPELAPIWPALAAHPASEVIETLELDASGATHCLELVMSGDYVREATRAWQEGAHRAGYECTSSGRERRCRSGDVTLAMQDGVGEEDARLSALAVRIAGEDPPAASIRACVHALGPSRLSAIDERLHRASLLAPWRELHERLGLARLREVRWMRSAEREDVVRVRYAGDAEAFELATRWAREAGLSGGDASLSRIGPPIDLALELSTARIELSLAREP